MSQSPSNDRRFHNLQGEMNRSPDEMHSSMGNTPARQNAKADEWRPAMEVLPKGNDLVIRVELSGVKMGDVDITLRDTELTISGKRKAKDEEARSDYYVRERRYGSFRRRLTLPEGIDDSKITAHYNDGLLEIMVPGAGSVKQPKHIKIEGLGEGGSKKS